MAMKVVMFSFLLAVAFSDRVGATEWGSSIFGGVAEAVADNEDESSLNFACYSRATTPEQAGTLGFAIRSARDTFQGIARGRVKVVVKIDGKAHGELTMDSKASNGTFVLIARFGSEPKVVLGLSELSRAMIRGKSMVFEVADFDASLRFDLKGARRALEGIVPCS
jgi:hypothetical protein